MIKIIEPTKIKISYGGSFKITFKLSINFSSHFIAIFLFPPILYDQSSPDPLHYNPLLFSPAELADKFDWKRHSDRLFTNLRQLPYAFFLLFSNRHIFEVSN